MIKSSEEAIAKVLAGLQTSEAPVGMERRILKAVRDHASARSRLGWHWSRPIWPITQARPILTRSLFFGVALTGILGIAFTIPSLYRQHRIRSTSAQLKMTTTSTESVPLATRSLVASSAAPPPPASVMRSLVKRQGRAAGLVRRDDSVALREMRAASRPAPPLPLTKEEKLLLRLVRTTGPEELATLNSDVRARQEAESETEFQKFFEQQPAKHNEHN
jgi:hypothetical protein